MSLSPDSIPTQETEAKGAKAPDQASQVSVSLSQNINL